MLRYYKNETGKTEITVVDAEHCIEFNIVLTYMGEFGRYQKFLLLTLFPFLFSWAWIYLTQKFIIAVPYDHWCYESKLVQLSKEEQINLAIPRYTNNDYDRCAIYDTNYTYLLESNITKANKSWPQKPCRKWVYDQRQLPYESIATEYNWVCDKEDLRIYTFTVHLCGSIVGGLLLGYSTDHWGRIPTLAVSILCALVGGVLIPACTSFSWFSFIRFFEGMAFDQCYLPMYILVMEYLGPKYRTFVTNLSMAVYFTIGSVFVPWLAYWCRNWRLFAFVSLIPILFQLLTLIFLSESARWLITVGKLDDAINIVKHVAKLNRKVIPENIMESFQLCCEFKYKQNMPRKKYTILDLFKSWTFIRIVLILCITFMISNLLYDAHDRVLLRIGPEIFYTFSIMCLMEIPASLIVLFLLDFSGRRVLALIAFVACALGSFYGATIKTNYASAVTSISCRFFTIITYNIGLQWGVELLPTVLRGQGMALVHILRFGLVFSPYITRSKHFFTSMPMIISGLLSTFAAILVCFLPETNGHDLTQTLDEAEELWNQQDIIPWRKRRNNHESQV